MSQRIERINELVRQELGRFIMREVELPENSLVTITRVETTPDMKNAKVYVTILPDNLRGTILELLRKNNRQLHELLKAEIENKIVPNFNFLIDDQEVYANKIDRILDEIRKE